MPIVARVLKSLRSELPSVWRGLRRINPHPFIRWVKWIFKKPAYPQMADGLANLHLGCGPVNHPAFINVDMVPHAHIHHLRQIDDLSIFDTESVDLIYASHCLEHFPLRKLASVLDEWARVLRTGGTLRLSVPDFDAIVDIYQASGRDLDKVSGAIVGGQEYEFNFHYAVFNRASLTERLELAGFTNVQEWTPGSSDQTTFDDWSGKSFMVGDQSFPISLNLEAIKG